jgi:hypothetical protein
MIRIGSPRHSSAALRRLSTGHDHARRRAALDNRLVDQSLLCDAGTAVAIGQLSSPPLRPPPKELLNVRGQQITSAENPIASDALLRPTSRGFLPWRFADAGPGVRGTIIMGRHPKTFTGTEVQCDKTY